MSLCLFALWWLGLLEIGMLAQVLIIQLLDKGHISGFRDNALFIQDRDDTQRLLNQLNAGLQIETKIDESPLDAFTLVFFLLQHEHVVVEELLKTLIDEVDPQLLKTVQIEDLESGNI